MEQETKGKTRRRIPWWLLFGLSIGAFYLIIRGGVRTWRGKPHKYPYTLRILRCNTSVK